VKISFDPAKRDRTLRDRGLDFLDSAEVFVGRSFGFADERSDYGETRMITVGYLRGRMVIVVWTERGETRRMISMRKANDREKAYFGQRLAEG
jgi:uncharacterized DUF497 family protein